MSREARRPAGPKKRPVLVFLAKCAAYWGIALWLVSSVPAIENWGINLTIGTLVSTLKPIDHRIARVGNTIHGPRTSIEIVPDCSPHMPYLIFAGVVLAFPASWRQRLLGLLLGAVVIHAFNIIRIATLMWILGWRSSWFEFTHVYLWQTGTVLIVFITFAIWLRTLAKRPRTA